MTLPAGERLVFNYIQNLLSRVVDVHLTSPHNSLVDNAKYHFLSEAIKHLDLITEANWNCTVRRRNNSFKHTKAKE